MTSMVRNFTGQPLYSNLTSDIHGEKLYRATIIFQLLCSAVYEDSAGVVLSSCLDSDFKSEQKFNRSLLFSVLVV